jgi:hypothetical protein
LHQVFKIPTKIKMKFLNYSKSSSYKNKIGCIEKP